MLRPPFPFLWLLAALSPVAACQGGFLTQLTASASTAPTAGVVVNPEVAAALAADSPTASVIRRLSKVEYNNTVRDLLGTSLTPADAFVADDLTGGFDTVGSTLQISPTLLIGYLTAAETLAQQAAVPATSGIPGAIACQANEAEPACLSRTLVELAARAWRRPLETSEQAWLLAVADTAPGGAHADKLSQGIIALLMSPQFLFHVELDANPASTDVGSLTDNELASRLSYLLWSSMPDAALFAAAQDETLHQEAVLAGHIDRMLADARSQTLVSHFAGLWLGLNRAAIFAANPQDYPDFTADIRTAMITETTTFLNDYILGDQPLVRMLDANYTFLSPPLAAYYGLPSAQGDTFVRTSLPLDGPAPRRGLLTQGAMLIAQNDPDGTNIIRRGKSVLTSLLCTSIGSPPAGAGNLPASSSEPNQTQRQRLEGHITNPSCAGCHSLMDPIGYAFEMFGPDAKVRTTDNGSPIDASGTFNNQSFDGAQSFVSLLAQSTAINACATKMLYTFALGVVPTTGDANNIADLTNAYAGAGGHMRDLIKIMAMSNMFRQRRAQGVPS